MITFCCILPFSLLTIILSVDIVQNLKTLSNKLRTNIFARINYNNAMTSFLCLIWCSVHIKQKYSSFAKNLYKGWLISNAHSEISRKRDHVFKQMKVKYNILATN